MEFETATDLLTWKNAEVEEKIILEFTQQYEKLTDEEKVDLIKTAKSAHSEYVQKIVERAKDPKKRKIEIEIGGDPSKGEIKESDIQDIMKMIEDMNGQVSRPKGEQRKLDRVNLSWISSTPIDH